MKKKDKQVGFHYRAKEIKRNKGLNDDYKTVISFIIPPYESSISHIHNNSI